MNFKLEIPDAVDQEISDLLDNIEVFQGSQKADALAKQLAKQLKIIQAHPYRFSIYYEEPFLSRGYRRFPVGKYHRGFYRINEDIETITLIHVGHSYRNAMTVLRDR